MNRTLPLFHAADAASAALSGGQAPRSWRRECERRATRLRALGRAALWGDELSARAPGLTDTPLWGERLVELAAQTPARHEEEDAAARSRTPGAWPPTRPAHTPAETNRARRQTSSHQTRAASPPPLPRAFPPHPAGAHGHDRQFSDVNHPAPGDSPRALVVSDLNGHDEHVHSSPRMIEPGRTSPLRPHQDGGCREQLEDGRSAHFNEHQNAHAPTARAEFDPAEVFTLSEDSPASVRRDVETRESRGAFVPEVEGLSRQASHELLRRLAGRNGSLPVQYQKNSRLASSKQSGAAASENSGTTPSRSYGMTPALAEDQHSPPPPAQARTTPHTTTRAWPRPLGQQPPDSPRGHMPDASGSRGGRVRPPDAVALHSRGRQWWGVLAARTALSLRRAGVLPAAPGHTGTQLLTRQGFLNVNGEPAPRDLLTRLAGGSVAASGAARQSAERRGDGRQRSAPRPLRGETPQTFPDAGSNVFTTGGGPAVLPDQSRSPGLDSQQLRVSATAEASAPGVNTSLMSVNNYLSGAETSLPGAAASPVVAESLPPLLPPPLVGMPVLPVALATAREGARDESRESAEDLDALAAKIKLILDEQARRHGIDV